VGSNASLGTQIVPASYFLQMQQPRTQVREVKGSTVVCRTPGVLANQGKKDDLNVRCVFKLGQLRIALSTHFHIQVSAFVLPFHLYLRI
jgi:hypothetical protein